jgi:alpha-glucosidase
MYREALALRRKLLTGDRLTWVQAPAGVLAFDRAEDFRCTVNMTGSPVTLPAPGSLQLASGPVTLEGSSAVLPPDTTAWWTL